MSAPSTLTTIRTKIRRLTGRPSPQQISDSEIDDYVNTFYQYDLPEHLRLFSNTGTFTFMTEANVDQYNMRTATPAAPEFNALTVTFDGAPRQAVDVYYNLQPPAYVAGYPCSYSQSMDQFFRTYPPLGDLITTVVGDGGVGPYTFTLTNIPALQNSISIGTIDNTGATIKVVDDPQDRENGDWVISNLLTAVTGSINYVTGVGTITFTNNIPAGNEITIIYTPYQPSRPQAVLFFDNIITLRPVPDRPYPVALNAFLTPSALLNADDNPILKQWWQYLAYGAAKKIFEDSQDPEGVDQIIKEFENQEALVLNRHVVQQTLERTATIYTEMSGGPYNNFSNRF